MRRWALALAVLFGCASASGLQRAETIGKGHTQFGGAMSGQLYAARDGRVGWPYVEAFFRYGAGDRVDLSAALSPISLRGSVKVMVWRADRLIVSVAPEAGGGAFGANNEGGDVSAAFPVLVGVPVGDNELVLGARVAWAAWQPAAGYDGTAAGMGASVGFSYRLGGAQLLPELSLLVPLSPLELKLGDRVLTGRGAFLQFGFALTFDD
jgi:hypothetical protein